MDKTLTTDTALEPAAGRVADHKAAIARIHAEMDRLNGQIAESQAETDRVRTETREVVARIKAT